MRQQPTRRLSFVERRQQLLNAIQDYQHLHGMAPSRRDLADATGSSVFAVQQHLVALEAEGYLTMQPNIARSIQLTDKANEPYRLPVFEEVNP